MSPKRIELLFTALIVLLLACGLWEARAWPLHSRIFPWSIGLGVLVLALAQLIKSVREVISAGTRTDHDINATTPSSDSEHREIQASSKGMALEGFARPDKVVQRRVIVM